jgi:hypothetical protein
MPDDLEDRAFEEPWMDILIREEKEGVNAPPTGAEWSWSSDEPFPWEDEGAATWDEWVRKTGPAR